MTDESLMLSVKNDDLDKAAILYERYKKKLYGFFLYRSYNEQERSEDCVQQVFYRIIKYRQSYKEGSNFRMWMYSIARNVQYLESKKEAIQSNLKETAPAEEGYSMINDDHEAIQYALKLLPEAQREVLLMSKFLCLKYEEIAEIHNCSVGVIKTRVFRAMKELKDVYFKVT